MSETTNAEKLRIRANAIVWVIATSDEESALLDPLPEGAEMVEEATDGMQAAILFVEDRERLMAELDEIIPQLGSTPSVWISYPTSRRSDVDRALIAGLVENYGWHDVDATRLDEEWSAVRLKQR